jgi:hypothetical protein
MIGAMKSPPIDNLVQLLPRQMRAAKSNPNAVISEADLAVLADEHRWAWLCEMNRLSTSRAPRTEQVLPPNPPACIDVAA